MRIPVVSAAVLGLSLSTATATAGQSHYLLARAFDQFTSTSSIQPPDLTPFVEETHQNGVAGVNPGFISNHASANSDSGHLLVTSTAARPAGDLTVVEPSGWDLAARMEEVLEPASPATTGMRFTLVFVGAGSVTSPNPMLIRLAATLRVGNCQLSLTRDLSPGASGDLEPNDGCSQVAGMTGTINAGGLTIDVDQFGSSGVSLEAQVDAEFMYSGGFVGSFELSASAQVHVEGIGGGVTGKSPTFGSKAPTPDGGVGDDGGSGGSSGSSGGSSGGSGGSGGGSGGSSGGATVDGGGGSSGGAATPGANDNSGCSVGAAGSSTSTAAGFGLALAAAAFVRRSRRARARRSRT